MGPLRMASRNHIVLKALGLLHVIADSAALGVLGRSIWLND
jgi:hypothetical protein